MLGGVDAGGNACPSLHVATAVFTAYWLDHVVRDMGLGTRGRVCNALWFIAIAWSTMATKQHVSLDVISGFALGSVFAWMSLWRRRIVGWDEYQMQRKKRR